MQKLEYPRLTTNEFVTLKNQNFGKLILWLRTCALLSIDSFDLTEDEKSDAFTRDIVRYCGALKKAEGPGQAVKYTVKGTRWRASSALKKKCRRLKHEIPLTAELLQEVPGSDAPWACHAATLQYQADQRAAEWREISARRTSQLLSELKPHERALFHWVFTENEDAESFASRRGISVGTLYTQKNRLIARLMKIGAAILRRECEQTRGEL